ncbi:MAG: phytoene/squalene synthase family protein [Planctomycetota bacterium]
MDPGATANRVTSAAAAESKANKPVERTAEEQNVVSIGSATTLENHLLQGVSRTFAFSIPELPIGLRPAVVNGYLLCRIADTIEDEEALDSGTKSELLEHFAKVVSGESPAAGFVEALAPRLTSITPAAEHELVRHTAQVVASTHGFEDRQHKALVRCVRIMCDGMARYGVLGRGDGLADAAALQEYCYIVAGVVGEMLTEIFCAYSPAIEAEREGLQRTTVSFGQGLQMTNILKDVWEDRERGFCWLPRAVFLAHGFDLADLRPGEAPRGFRAGMNELLAVAHGHLQDSLEYSLLIPARERGIRHFCLWNLNMAALTLRKIHANLDYRSGSDVKISRRAVRSTVLCTNLATPSDRALRWLFSYCSRGLPPALHGPAPR